MLEPDGGRGRLLKDSVTYTAHSLTQAEHTAHQVNMSGHYVPTPNCLVMTPECVTTDHMNKSKRCIQTTNVCFSSFSKVASSMS